jgi:hypothetical protein
MLQSPTCRVKAFSFLASRPAPGLPTRTTLLSSNENVSVSDNANDSVSNNANDFAPGNRNENVSVSSNNNDPVSGNENSTSTDNADAGSLSSHGSAQWTPFTLRWYFIMVPAILAILCSIVVATLYWHSHKKNGLGPETSAMPGWKFVPILIAVIYTQLTSMILGAMKRTEPFARLAKPPNHIPISR